MIAFDFGENWKGFVSHALTGERCEQARRDFYSLLDGISLQGRSFVDVGFGQGLSLLIAAEAGCVVTGCDINDKNMDAMEISARAFSGIQWRDIPLIIGSILDVETVELLKARSPSGDGYDIVHSWGVLHHTGDMRKAIEQAASLVKERGHLVLALYNRHWTSWLWRIIKRVYNGMPRFGKKAMVFSFVPVIYVAKFLVTGGNPLRQERGMNFYYDVVDWVGGYPYEYASIAEVVDIVCGLGFSVVKTLPARVPTGCNEFVFRRQ